jgi:hypothetical protein
MTAARPRIAMAPLVLPEGTTISFGEVAGRTLPGAVQILIETAEGAMPLFP